MNKQLEQLFNMPPVETVQDDVVVMPMDIVEDSAPPSDSLDSRIDRALPQVRNIPETEGEVDHIAEEAMKTYQEIKDLAMNVEPRHSAELLAVAAQLLKTALDAKQSKTDAKLRTVSLQLQALRAKAKEPNANMVETQGHVVGNRNQLLASIRNSKENAK